MESPNRAIIKPCCVVLEPVTPKANVEFSSELKRAINERNLLTTKTRKRVSEALDEIASENKEGSRRLKKSKIIKEIIESEENFIRQLEVITEYFVKPTLERELLKSKDFDVLFRDLTSIYNINKSLLEELQKNPNKVANAFSRIAPFFKSYSFYASGFKKSLEFLQNCHRDHPKFAKFLENQETRPEVQSKLSALLIVPIQRVPRYKLLLVSLFNLTSPKEEDYDVLLDSLHKIENAADHINKVIKEQENMQRLIEVQRYMISGEPKLITPGRNLIKEGVLQKIGQTSHSQKIYVVLMNDIIMFCKMKKGDLKINSLKCCGIYPLAKCKVQILHDKGAFKVICQDEEMAFYDTSYAETITWVEEIEAAIDTLVSDRKTLRKESTVRRPVKRKDLREYNELGISPGKKLKKKNNYFEDKQIKSPLMLTRRRPLRTTFNIPSDHQRSPSIFITLKPTVEDSKENRIVEKKNNEVFVFGQPHPDRGFSFKMNQWLCGIGSSVKKFFGYK